MNRKYIVIIKYKKTITTIYRCHNNYVNEKTQFNIFVVTKTFHLIWSNNELASKECGVLFISSTLVRGASSSMAGFNFLLLLANITNSFI